MGTTGAEEALKWQEADAHGVVVSKLDKWHCSIWKHGHNHVCQYCKEYTVNLEIFVQLH